MNSSQGRLAFLVLALALVLCSFAARTVRHRGLKLPGHASWVTTDPDSQYQMRRVARALEEGKVAGTDPYLDHPHGAPIPWPPYYAAFLSRVLGPFAPRDPQLRRAWIETRVASFPLFFGVLATLLAAWVGRSLGGNLGGVVAGAYHACCTASIAYSKGGNGDHHALVSLLAGGLLLATSLALRDGGLDRPRRCAGFGALMGLLAGVLLGCWVGALMYVVEVQLVLGWLICLHAREPRAGLAPLGAAFHGAALLAVLPAVLASPWTERTPWIAVNLSWFHPAFLALGAAVFVPLPLVGARLRRSYPALVAVVLIGLGVFVAFADAAPAAAVREGFRWVSRVDAFMSGVGESRPLIGGAATWADLTSALGYGVLLLPLAWAAGAWVAVRRGELVLLPWVVAAPLLALQAARQARFADALVIPLAVLLAWACARLLARLRGRAENTLWAPLGLVLAIGANAPSVAECLRAREAAQRPAHEREGPVTVSVRTMCDWLSRRPRRAGPPAGVLANWMWGHTIEWAADLPTVATNFGSYIGESSFRAPARFFMEEDPAAAERQLAERDVRYVLLTSRLPGYLEMLIATGAPERRARYVEQGADRGEVLPGWFRTMGARLMFDGEVFYPMGRPRNLTDGDERPLGFLRLVHVAPLVDPTRLLRSPADRSPAGWVYERVAGAVVEARGDPGSVLEVELRLRYPKARKTLVFSSRAETDAGGLARVRVPYATDRPNGDGRVDPGAARWKFAGLEGELVLPEAAVLAGGTVSVP